MEAQRLAVNTWIRTQANYDAVVDYDRLMSGGPVYDGNASLKPEFVCSGDQVHPNAAAYRAMGEFIDLGVFKSRRARTRLNTATSARRPNTQMEPTRR
jgi:lysophospholipase L1-like esterase